MIFSWKKKSFILGAALLFALFGTLAHAQTIPDVSSYDSSVNEQDFDFEITPENPGPHDMVTIRITSNLVDTNRYLITWTVDGAVVSSGIGKRSITVQTKDYGERTLVVWAIQLADSIIQKQLVLAPQDTTLLWEAVDAYVPPFYPGKKLPSYESLVRIAALPNFLADHRSVATKDAVYTWTRNKSVATDAGGYGKDSILIQHNRVRTSEAIEVDASSTSGSARAHAKITIPFYDTKILFYEIDPLSGIKSPLAKSSLFFDRESTTIEAAPYFFSVINKNPNNLKFSWVMNGKPVSLANTKKKNVITLQKPAASGSAQIGLTVENTSKLFQSAKNSFSILFRK